MPAVLSSGGFQDLLQPQATFSFAPLTGRRKISYGDHPLAVGASGSCLVPWQMPALWRLNRPWDSGPLSGSTQAT